MFEQHKLVSSKGGKRQRLDGWRKSVDMRSVDLCSKDNYETLKNIIKIENRKEKEVNLDRDTEEKQITRRLS